MIKVKACYKESVLNPLLAALPEISLSPDCLDLFAVLPPFDEADLKLPVEIRIQIINRIHAIIYPTRGYIDLATLIGDLLLTGSTNIDPLSLGYVRTLNCKNLLEVDSCSSPRGKVAYLHGQPGTGKTVAISRILSLYPAIISHAFYRQEPFPFEQIPWLYIRTPFNAYVRALSHAIATKIDWLINSNYKDTVYSSIIDNDYVCEQTLRLFLQHGISLLILDDIDRLALADVHSRTEFLLMISGLNKLGVSLLLVGNEIPEDLFTDLRKINKDNFSTLSWEPLNFSEEWTEFIELLFSYNWAKAPITDKERMAYYLFDSSKGIVCRAKMIYFLCEQRMVAYEDRMSEELIQQIVSRHGIR